LFARIALVVLGFAGGLITVAVLDHFLLPNGEPVRTTGEFSLGSAAYRDDSACPDASTRDMAGTWRGETVFPSGLVQRWTNTRAADGGYFAEFEFYEAGQLVETSAERGYWSFSGCLYSTLVREVDSYPALFQEVYRVHVLEDDYVRYSNYRTGSAFEQHRVSESG